MPGHTPDGNGHIVRQALSDLSVVELGVGFAAGWCGKAFADLGADVLKVEPSDGDPLRADAGMFAHLHTNKRSAIIDVAPANAASMVLTVLTSRTGPVSYYKQVIRPSP